MARSVPVVLAAYNEQMVRAILQHGGAWMRPGDQIDLVSGNSAKPVSVPTLNAWATELAPILGSGVELAAHTAGLSNVEAISAGAAPAFRSIRYDYEPNFEPEFTWDFRATLQLMDRFAQSCRRHERRAVAYPTGRPLREAPLQQYGWDYGEIGRRVDELDPQTQHWASLGPGPWSEIIGRLHEQLARAGQSDSRPNLQLTIGQGGNAIDPDSAVQRFHEAERLGIARLFVWWAPEMEPAVEKFLGALDS